MTDPSAAAIRHMSRHAMLRNDGSVVTRGGPIQADAREPDAAGAVVVDALPAFNLNLSVSPP